MKSLRNLRVIDVLISTMNFRLSKSIKIIITAEVSMQYSKIIRVIISINRKIVAKDLLGYQWN